MRLLILSDSHQEINAMAEAVRREAPDAVLHLGDHFEDAQKLAQLFPEIPLHAVEGNTDYAPGAPVELLLTFEGKRVYMTHGHLFGVKMGLHSIKRKGDAVAADLVLFGHTHQPLLQDAGDMTLMNPGSIGRYGRGYGKNNPTYGVVEIVNGEMKCWVRKAGE
jgi:putative phosphoesterase